MFTMRQMSEGAIKYYKGLNILFVDQTKVFDTVDRNNFWEKLENYDIKGQLLHNIRA